MASAAAKRDSVLGFDSDIARSLIRVHYSRSGNGARRASPDGRNSSLGIRLTLADQCAVQPGLGVTPVAVGGCPRNSQEIRGFLDRQAREVAELDEFGLHRVMRG